MTQSDLRLFRVPHTLCACFSSRGPAWTRYHTPLSPRSTRIGCMRRLVSTSPFAVCTLAHVDLATSSLFTEAIWIRQPPVGPDILSIRLAMLGPAACGVEGLSATGGAVAGAAGAGVVAAGAAVDALCNGVGALVASGSGLGTAGVGSTPPAGSFGVSAAGSSFSGWTGTVLGWMRL